MLMASAWSGMPGVGLEIKKKQLQNLQKRKKKVNPVKPLSSLRSRSTSKDRLEQQIFDEASRLKSGSNVLVASLCDGHLQAVVAARW